MILKQNNVITKYAKGDRYVPHKLYREVKSRKKCRYCKKKRKKKEVFELHHIIPLSQGGKSELNNMVACCKECHKQKHRED